MGQELIFTIKWFLFMTLNKRFHDFTINSNQTKEMRLFLY